MDWELVVDLPDDAVENWDVSIILTNDRGIDDPYAVTKLLTALGVAAAGGAGGLALGTSEAKTFAAYVAAAAKGVGGEVVKKIVTSFFDEWPKCAGWVFNVGLAWNRDNFAKSVGSLTLESKIDAVADGCRQPQYEVDITIKSESIPQFGTSEKVRQRQYHPMKTPARSKWGGTWYDAITSPSIAVTIDPASVGGPSMYRVAISERAAYRKTRRSVIDETFDPVEELSLRDAYYFGKIVNPKATGITAADALGNASARVKDIQQEVELAANWKGAASAGNPSGTSSGLLTSVKQIRTLEAVRAGKAKKKFGTDVQGLDRDVIDEVVSMSVTENGATLYIEKYGITLRLYEVEDTMESGQLRRWGPVLRYYRKPSIEAAVADVQLAKYKLIK